MVAIEVNLKLREKEFQDLMEIYLRREYSYTRAEIFREVYVNGSVADFVVFTPYAQGLVHVYELKMYDDKDKKRLTRQVNDYLEVADSVTVAVFGGVPNMVLPESVSIMNVRVENGWLNYSYLGDKKYRQVNLKENVNWYKKLVLVKQLNKIWSNKAYYGEKIQKYLQRKVDRLNKENLKNDI